jgi:hypothetical protein
MIAYTMEFAFKLRDQVLIKEIGRAGVVEALLVDSLGPQYRIAYWNDGVRKSEWLYAEEVERRADS